MKLVQHIINVNNRSNKSRYYLSENDYGKITAFNVKEGKKVFDSTEEFLSWFKTNAIDAIKGKVLVR